MKSQPCTLTAVFTRWHHVTKFDKLHKMIRKQNRLNRRNRLEAFLEESVPFVLRNQMHEWYRRVRTLCPKQQHRRIQMFDPTGAPMSQDQEFDRLVEYFQNLFTDVHSPLPHPPPLKTIPFTEEDVQLELERLSITKALAPDGFPALIWKQFAPQLTPIIYACIRQAWTSDPCIPPTRWSTGWLHLLPKPNKTPNKPEALRPICLQHPVNKIMSGIHCRLMQSYTYPALKTMPLYAYMAHRGTKDCLLTISQHCRLVREMCRVHGKDQAKQGLWGGLQISLDMEKAFDTISRSMVSRALHAFDMSADLQHLVHSWLAPHQYCISHKELVGMFQVSGGIKQGSKDAPFFWTISMYLILHDLLAQYDQAWITNHVLIYADDIHLRWIITSPSEGLAALHDLSFLLRVFRAYGLRINQQKSVALTRMVGRALNPFLRRWTSRPTTGPILHLPDANLTIPLMSKTSYLGTIVSYRAWEADTIRRRITAAQTCFRILRRWLLDKHHDIKIRIRLYNQCVLPTVLYGVFEMGITYQGSQPIIGMINNHHRLIAHVPVHLTRIPTTEFFTSLGLRPPWITLQKHFHRLTTALNHRRDFLRSSAMDDSVADVCVTIPDYPEAQIITPLHASMPSPQEPVLRCPECARAFTQARTYKRHLREHHQIPCNPDDLFLPLRDALDGHSTCRHCLKRFTDFYRLRDHINKRVCMSFDPAKDIIVPIYDRPDLRMHLRYKSIPGLLLNKALMSELANHCAYCHSAIAARSIRMHYKDAHPQLLQYEQLHRTQVYGLAQLGSGKGQCILCEQTNNNVQSHQCGVLFQISVMLGQTYDVSHFPVMPVTLRTLPEDRPEDDRLTTRPVLTLSTQAEPLRDSSSAVRQTSASSTTAGHSGSTSLHKCTRCQMAFLTATGLTQHMQESHDTNPSDSTSAPPAQVQKKLNEVKRGMGVCWLRLYFRPIKMQTHKEELS